jgi:hypothetical protein
VLADPPSDGPVIDAGHLKLSHPGTMYRLAGPKAS